MMRYSLVLSSMLMLAHNFISLCLLYKLIIMGRNSTMWLSGHSFPVVVFTFSIMP
jgi:hypothetical protein